MRYLTFITVFFSIIINIFGQTTQSSLPDTTLKMQYSELLNKMGIEGKGTINRFYNKKINVAQSEKLKAEGVDIIKIANRIVGDRSYQENALFSEAIITGTVVSLEYYSNITDKFHSKYKILIEKKHKGGALPDTIEIMQFSGMISEERYVYKEGEPKLNIGDRAMFFLDYVSVELIPSNVGPNKFKGNGTNAPFIVKGKYSIRQGFILDDDGKRIETYDLAIEKSKKINDINMLNFSQYFRENSTK